MRPLHLKRYLVAGLLTFLPIWLTWIAFKFVFSLLAQVSAPLVDAVTAAIGAQFPHMAEWLRTGWLLSILAIATTLVTLYLLGVAASRVFGRRVLESIEAMLDRIPVVHSIYGGAKKLMSVLQNKPSGTQRVVLLDFPSPPLKAVGFVTQVFHDADGHELAAVYVPTTPNPTGGYLEIVPVERLIATDWSVDQAMAFILSAGAVVPEAALPGAAARGTAAQ